MISDPQKLYRFLAKPGIELAALMFASDDVVWDSWRYIAEENVPNLRHTNEVIGGYVTAGARIHLYGYRDSLQERVLYCDSDWIIYIEPTAEPRWFKPATDWSYDFRTETGFHIEEFVSGEPKNYAYRIVDPVTGCAKMYAKSEE